MKEEWKEFYPGYLVSNLGQIRKLALKKKNVETTKTGTKRVETARYLSLMIKKNWYYVHKIVAAAFVPNPNPALFTDIKHLNGDLTDNRAENLAWVHPAMIEKYRQKEGSKNWSTGKHYKVRVKYEVLIGNASIGIKNLGLFNTRADALRSIAHWEKLNGKADRTNNDQTIS